VTQVRVDVPGAEYTVSIGRGDVHSVGERLRALTTAKIAALVTDQTVGDRYALVVDTSLARQGFEVVSFTVPPGETSKNWSVAGELLESFAAHGLGRDSVVVALGGGVVGDLAGFVAATYLRGVDFYQVPTTLLAMVDSSVGGKTAVDLSAGKNLAGAFKQPLGVLVDPAVLDTLPEPEWQSGMAEVAKSAILDAGDFLEWIEANSAALVEHQPAAVEEAIRRSIEFKAGVVARDEKEEGPRECLNYGHTLGHALEKVLGYGTITHGSAVAEGIRFAARVAVQCAGALKAFAKRQDKLLDALGLEPIRRHVQPMEVLAAMRGDKKAREGAIRFVLASAPGEWRCEPVDDIIISQHLEAWAATKLARPAEDGEGE